MQGAHVTGQLGRFAALLTALLASLGALLNYGIIATQNQAILLKNDAVIALIAASRPPAQGSPSAAAALAQRRLLDQQAADMSLQSDRLMMPHTLYAQALVLVEIAVAMASVAALAERTWLLAGAGAVGLAALALALAGAL